MKRAVNGVGPWYTMVKNGALVPPDAQNERRENMKQFIQALGRSVEALTYQGSGLFNDSSKVLWLNPS